MKCDRPKCNRTAPSDELYCSERCYELDYGPPVAPLARNKYGGVGTGIEWQRRRAVILPRQERPTI